MTHRDLIFASALFLLLAAVSTHSAWAQQYVFRSIDMPGGAATYIGDNSNKGAIPGCYQVGSFSAGRRGFLLSHGVFKPVNYPGATDTCPEGASGNGKVVGHWVDKSANEHGFLLTGTKYSSFDYPGAVFTLGFGVNDSGEIVGVYYDGTAEHSFKLKSGKFTTIDPPGAAGSEAEAINAAGQVVGAYSLTDPLLNSGLQGYVLSGGSYTTIDDPGATGTVAGGINNSGDYAGWYSDSAGAYHGFTDIGGTFANVDYPGATDTFAFEINDSGQIDGVWNGAVSVAYDVHGFLATPLNGLNAPGNEPREKRPASHK